MRGAPRLIATTVAVVLALVLQVTVLPRMGWPDAGIGVVPGLVLLVVVAVGQLTDARFATLTGFGAGLLLDLAPPSDHVAGRWALAFLVVGYVVGRLSHDHQPESAGLGLLDPEATGLRRPPLGLMVAAAAGGSFVGNSIYALSGIVLNEPAVGFGGLLHLVLLSVVLDAVAALLVVPALVLCYRAANRLSGRPVPRVTPRLRRPVA